MLTTILVSAADLSGAGAFIAQIAAYDASVNSATLVMQGCVTVGLNRLLSPHSNTTASLLLAIVATLNPSASSITVTATASDAARIAGLVTRLGSTTALVTGCAARTGLGLLQGINANAHPLRTS